MPPIGHGYLTKVAITEGEDLWEKVEGVEPETGSRAYDWTRR